MRRDLAGGFLSALLLFCAAMGAAQDAQNESKAPQKRKTAGNAVGIIKPNKELLEYFGLASPESPVFRPKEGAPVRRFPNRDTEDYLSRGSGNPQNGIASGARPRSVPKIQDLLPPNSIDPADFDSARRKTIDSQRLKTPPPNPAIVSKTAEEGVEVCCRPTEFVVGIIADHCYLKLKGRKIAHGMITPKDPQEYQAAFLGNAPAPFSSEPLDHPINPSLKNGKCELVAGTTIKDEDCLLQAQNALKPGNYNLFENNCNTWVSRLLQYCKIRYTFPGKAVGAYPASGFAGLRPAIRIGPLDTQGTEPSRAEENRLLISSDENPSQVPAIGLEIKW